METKKETFEEIENEMNIAVDMVLQDNEYIKQAIEKNEITDDMLKFLAFEANMQFRSRMQFISRNKMNEDPSYRDAFRKAVAKRIVNLARISDLGKV